MSLLRWRVAGVLGIAFFSVALASAQQTIFNVPSADILDRGKVYAELDAAWRVADPAFSAFTPRLVVGIGHRIEVGINVPGNVQPGIDHTTIVPAIKWKPRNEGKSGWGLILGDQLFFPVHNRRYDAGNYFYAAVVRSFRRGTRVSAGAYHFTADVVAPSAQRAGAQVTFEQAVGQSLTVAADWYSGKHALGYLTPGVIWKPQSHVTIYFGYSLGNTGLDRGNHYFLTELGINLN